MLAVYNSNLEITKMIADKCKDLNKQDCNGNSIVHYAMMNFDHETLRFLFSFKNLNYQIANK